MELTETSVSNVAFRLDSRASSVWVTPAAECGLLKGVTRTELFDNREISEGVVTLEEAQEAARVGSISIFYSCCFSLTNSFNSDRMGRSKSSVSMQ